MTQVWPACLEARGAPYQVILKDGTYVFVRKDTDECIRDDKHGDAGWLQACYSHWPAPECVRTQRLLNGVLTAEEVHALLSRAGLVVGVSSQAAGHRTLFALIKELSAQGCEAMVVAGGVIPQQDYGLLHEAGVKSVFGPGTRIPAAARTIIGDLEAALSEGDAQAASG